MRSKPVLSRRTLLESRFYLRKRKSRQRSSRSGNAPVVSPFGGTSSVPVNYWRGTNGARFATVFQPRARDGAAALVRQYGLEVPTCAEAAMYDAAAAGAASACMSRQVGAAIVSKDGELIAVGRNDAPKFGGGL